MSGTQPDAIVFEKYTRIGDQCKAILTVKQQTVCSNEEGPSFQNKTLPKGGYVKLLLVRKCDMS